MKLLALVNYRTNTHPAAGLKVCRRGFKTTGAWWMAKEGDVKSFTQVSALGVCVTNYCPYLCSRSEFNFVKVLLRPFVFLVRRRLFRTVYFKTESICLRHTAARETTAYLRIFICTCVCERS